MIENFENSPINLSFGNNFTTVKEHPNNIVELDISHSELLGILSADTHYKKRNIDKKDVYTINRHLTDQHKTNHGEQEEKPITTQTVELDVDQVVS